MLQSTRRFLASSLSSLSLAAIALATASGCDEQSASAKEPTKDEQQTPVQAEQKPAAAAELKGKSAYDEQAFQLSITAPDNIKAGTPTVAEIVLEAKAGFKVNAEYPLKFKFADSPGIKAAKATVRKDDAKMEKTRATVPLKVTVEKAGAATLAGKLSFSVCTDDRCLIEKRELALPLTAK